MRSAFGKNESEFGFGVEFDPEFAEVAASPDQFAAVWNNVGEVVSASPVPFGAPGSYSMDITRHVSDSTLAPTVNAQRTKNLQLPVLSQNTHYLTAAYEYSERTRILALDGEKLSLNDEELLEWLVNAEKQMLLGTDRHPVFETSLEDTACCIRRLPNGLIAMTEVPRHHVQALGARVRSLIGERPGSPISLSIETPLRSTARYFLTATKQGQAAFHPGRGSEVTAFVVLTSAGYSFGLWSPQAGLFSEYAFLAPDDVKLKAQRARLGASGEVALDDRRIEAYLQQAFDQLTLQLSQDKLDNLQLTSYAQVVWATEHGLSEIAASVAKTFAAKTGIEFVALKEPVDEAVVGGLLLGSYTFGEKSVSGAEILPPINLANDILVAADVGRMERYRGEQARLQERKNKALFTMFAAPVIATAGVFALIAYLIVSSLMTSWRDMRAIAKTDELRPALERRKSYEANLKWYKEFITEVSKLRKQQPVGMGLLYQLDANYPFNIDPAFYVSDMKLAPTGEVEMKGFSRNKDSVALFLKSLEFAGGVESGSRLFSDLAYEVQELASTPVNAGQAKLPTIAGSTLTGVERTAPGVVAWSIKGNYVPVAQFVPKPPPTGQPGAPAQATTPAPAAPKPAA